MRWWSSIRMIQTWLQACEQQTTFFQHVMLMVVDHPTPKNTSICQYSKRWLLIINLVEELSLYIVNNTNYVGCDYEMCHFVCVKGVTFWCIIVINLINQHICCDNDVTINMKMTCQIIFNNHGYNSYNSSISRFDSWLFCIWFNWNTPLWTHLYSIFSYKKK